MDVMQKKIAEAMIREGFGDKPPQNYGTLSFYYRMAKVAWDTVQRCSNPHAPPAD
jgi:hypothetical protein